MPGDVPVIADIDGDGRNDVTVFRAATGQWFVRYSSLAFNGSGVLQWGEPGDLPITLDFDGDGKTELTVNRPSTGAWFILYSSLGTPASTSFNGGWAGTCLCPSNDSDSKRAGERSGMTGDTRSSSE